jgi:tetratricopeptide (TPR) repeat protein
MKNFKDFFDRLLGGSRHRHEKNTLNEKLALGHYHKVGDFIGQKYEVYDVLGKGGFGVVYLVYSHETDSVYALKTFRDEYFQDAQARELFKKEARVWIELEHHPYLVRAYFVDEIADRLYIAMEHIAPDEQGLNSLESYLRFSPPDFILSLRWAIQFCFGMEYAYSKGLRCHRDIKPANILISQDKRVKISDFGLAGVFSSSTALPEIKLHVQGDRIGLSFQTLNGAVGTPTHMPPEQFINAAYCDERSDIYSFGIVLYQMRTGGQIPFIAQLPKDNSDEAAIRFWNSMRRLHTNASVPEINSRLSHVIYRCLEKKPNKRYQSFKELRLDLEYLLMRETKEMVKMPEIRELESWEWVNKGGSLKSLSRYEEAIYCFDMALKIDPRDAKAWFNKGACLNNLQRREEAIKCINRALEIDPRLSLAWLMKGGILNSLEHVDEANRCFDKALEVDPGNAQVWNMKGYSLGNLGRHTDAIPYYDKAIDIYPQLLFAWFNKGNSLNALGCHEEAVRCFDKALEIDSHDPRVLSNKGLSLSFLGRHQEEIRCYEMAIKVDSMHTPAWYNKALAEDALGLNQNAVRSYKRFIEVAPAGYEKEIEYVRHRLKELEGK